MSSESESSSPGEIRGTKQRTRSRDRLSGAQIMFAAILAVGLILAINFSTRLAASRPLNDYYESVEAEIEELKQTQATLIAERDFAQSDAFVEQWARSEGKMVRPGEVLVVPLPLGGTPVPTAPAPQIFVEQETSWPELKNWRLWWSLFFDSDPPDLLES